MFAPISYYLYCNLFRRYNKSLNIKLFLKTNDLETDIPELKKYLRFHKLYLENICYKCETAIKSEELVFDFNKNILKPIKIEKEILYLIEEKNKYRIRSDYLTNNSEITSSSSGTFSDTFSFSNIVNNKKSEELTFNLPLITLGKLKTREKILNKVRTCLNFS